MSEDTAAPEATVASEASVSTPAATETTGKPVKKLRKGFAAMDKAKQKEIASRGGKAAHQWGTAHEFDSSEAREAGRIGGKKVAEDREHMAKIGRQGGKNRGKKMAEAAKQQKVSGETA